MCRIAVDDGITDLVATPHFNYEFQPTVKQVREAIRELRDRLKDKEIPLEIHAGGDYHLTPELLTDMGRIITLGDNGRYFLLEFSPLVVPPNVLDVLKMFINRGFTPVITHPERNHYLRGRYNMLEEMAGLGCPLQLTADSLTGTFGSAVRQSAEDMLKMGLCHVLATDAHWENERPPRLSPSLAAAAGIVGESTARGFISANPRAILDGLDMPTAGRPLPRSGQPPSHS